MFEAVLHPGAASVWKRQVCVLSLDPPHRLRDRSAPHPRSDWHAGQAYENAARMCRESGDNQDMIDCIMHAGDYYKKAGRPNYAAEAYARGAKVGLE